MKTDTIIRTILLVIALVNQILVACGLSPLPIGDDQLELLLSTGATVIAAVWAWWKNNSFTYAAIEGDKLKDSIKAGDAR